MIAQCPVFLRKSKFCQYQQKHLAKKKLNFSRSALFHMKTKVCLKQFVHDCLQIHFFASNLPQAPYNLICLSIFVPSPNFVLKDVQVWSGTFSQKDKGNFSQNMTVFSNWSCEKDIKSKRKFCRQSWSKNDFLIFYQIFLSLQVKQSMIISNAQNICELPHELPNDLRLRRLGNQELSGKSQNFI